MPFFATLFSGRTFRCRAVVIAAALLVVTSSCGPATPVTPPADTAPTPRTSTSPRHAGPTPSARVVGASEASGGAERGTSSRWVSGSAEIQDFGDDAGKMVDLDVPGFGPAVVAVPVGGAAPAPVVVAAHANWDRPGWSCAWWRASFPRALILCPRGVLRPEAQSPEDPRFTYRDDEVLEREVDAGLAALRARWGLRVARGAMTWVSLSRGSYLGGFIAGRRPTDFPRLILVEGGQDPWTLAHAKAFAVGGGQNVLFVCGQAACRTESRLAASRLRHVGADARVVFVPGMGHGLNADARPIVAQQLAWLRHGSEVPEPHE